MTSKYFNKSQQNINKTDTTDEKMSSSDSQTKRVEIIEISESPEIVRKRNQLNDEFSDSPLNVPKNRNKRILSDSDEDDHKSKQIKTNEWSFGSQLSTDENKLAFEEMCESTIKELQDLFPEIDICEIQDALIQCNWSVFNASIKLGNLYDGNGADGDNEKNCATDEDRLDVYNVNSNERKICTNNERMKSMDYYRHKCREKSGDNSDNEEMATTSRHDFESIRNVKQKMSKLNKRDFEELSDNSDEEEDEYKQNNNAIVCDSSSDEDSDGGHKNPYKEKNSKNLFFRTQELKEKVVDFLQNSNTFELQTIPGVSAKKIDLIINLRPFVNWNDVLLKFGSSNLSTDILDKCSEVLKSREIVNRLMNSCEEISRDISETVERLKALDQPKVLNSAMKLSHYQMVGLNWLALMYKKKINCILADEMGLGKTIQVIALFAYLRESRKVTGPHLVIVPSSTLDNWSREFHNWCPDIKLMLYYGSQDERAEMREQINKNEVICDVILTTYNIAQSVSDKSLFKKNCFKYVVFDEAHYLKNMKTSRFSALMNLNAKYRLLLTGTPLQNNLLELMSLLIFTLPTMFRGRTDPIKTLFSYNNKESDHRIQYITDRTEQAKKIMKPFVLRRLKSEVLQELPLKMDVVLRCPMTETQELNYMELIEKYQREIKYKKITFEDSEPEEKFKRGTGMLMELRKMANHPLLVRTHYDDKKLRLMSKQILKEECYRAADPQIIFEDMQVMHDFELYNLCKKFRSISSFKLSEDLIFESGKFQELDSLLLKYQLEGKRVLLFSQFTMMLDIIQEYMDLRYFRYLRLDGNTKVSDRLDLIDKFNDDSDIFVFLLSTRAGGLGINLTAASVVIIHDIDFNPYNDKQAEDRCHRIGQTKEVIVYRLISQNSVEEGMHKIAEEKLKLGRDITTNNTDTKEDSEPSKTDVQSLLRSVLRL